ncbi:MAG: ferredoxin [Candidatus Beckwithbacteria bacterium]
MAKYKIKIIKDKCIGAAACAGIAPNTYKLDENNIAYVLSEDGDSAENVLLGAQSCPTNAIEIYDVQTNEKVWPKE